MSDKMSRFEKDVIFSIKSVVRLWRMLCCCAWVVCNEWIVDGCLADPVDLRRPFSACFHLVVVVVFYLNGL